MSVAIVVALVVLALVAIVFLRRKSTPLPPASTAKDNAPPPLPAPPKRPPTSAGAPPAAAPTKSNVNDDTLELDESALIASHTPPPISLTPAERPRTSARPSWPAPAPGDDIEALRTGLEATRGGFIARLAGLFKGKPKLDQATIEQIEEVLLTADLGVKTTQKLIDRVQVLAKKGGLEEGELWSVLRKEARDLFEVTAERLDFSKRPLVILVIGVNGVGKTTTIGKLASRFMHEGHTVLLAAGDTFRAAAVLQLEVWGRKVGCPVVRGKEGADPGSVIFDAIKKAKAEGVDVVIADTAGRLHTKAPLMDELKKVARTIEKALDGRGPDEVLLVLDSTNGQNAFQQTQLFKEALPVSSLVLTKLDGSAKGGVVLGIAAEHRLPVRYIGIGERVEDLRDFSPDAFVEALFARPDDGSAA